MRSRLSLIRGLIVGGFASCAIVVLFPHVQTAKADPAPAPAVAWQIVQTPLPTIFAPGSEAVNNSAPSFQIAATNVGGAVSPGATVTETLPPGLTVSAAQEPGISTPGHVEQACPVNGQVVECKIGEAIPAGGIIEMQVPLAVATDAPPSGRSTVVVEGGGTAARSEFTLRVSTADAPFEILPDNGLAFSASDEAGGAPTAGSQPFMATVRFAVSTFGTGVPSEALRSVSTELPRGFVVDPAATATRCPISTLALSQSKEPTVVCPPDSQVGIAILRLNAPSHPFTVPLYNLVPAHGVPAELGFELADLIVTVQGGLSGDLRLSARSREIYSRYNLNEIRLNLWGDPSDRRHDSERRGGAEKGIEGKEGCYGIGSPGCSVAPSPTRFLTMPTSCSDLPRFSVALDTWVGGHADLEAPLSNREFSPALPTGCGELAFSPTIGSKATTEAAESPAGLDFGLHQTQDESPGGRSTAALKDATVTLPEGMTLNPSAANGLDSCSEEQMGYQPQEGKIRFATTPQSCPDAAKVGSVSVATPLLEDPLPGSVYVARPFDNPFGSLLAIYIAVEDEETGIIAKLAGKVEADPATGRLTARFTENPELPLEDIDLHFFGGDRGVLKTPLTCGTATTTSTLTPWSTPEGADAHPSGSFQVTSGCSASEAVAPKTVAFNAGTVTPVAGAYSPFVLHIARPDASQHITGIETTLPEGLLGRLAGIPYCSEAAIAQARSREASEKGKLEQSSPSCPSSTEVGSVTVTAGAGNTPIAVSGHAYLAGPYKGAPLSLVVIVPAVAGPFDLGAVVDRVALNVGEYDARIHAVADPLPTILEGIPLDVRSIDLKLDRPGFTLNPTSCEAKAIEGSVSTQAGQSAPLTNHFQVADCEQLAFKPRLSIRLKGATGRTGHPALKAVVTYPKKGEYANIARAQVNLPHTEFLDQGNVAKSCTKPVLAARACPASSIYGRARAWSPLLEKPLEGPVYLVGGFGYKLPALVAELDGQIRVLLVGKVDTGKNKGIRNTFEAVPDAPVSRFVLELKGGKKYGLLENSADICAKRQLAGVSFRAQNGRLKRYAIRISNSCKGKGKKRGERGA